VQNSNKADTESKGPAPTADAHSNHVKELVVELDYIQVQDTQKTLKSNIPLFLELCAVKGVLFFPLPAWVSLETLGEIS
jgi:hypothetical protein